MYDSSPPNTTPHGALPAVYLFKKQVGRKIPSDLFFLTLTKSYQE